MYTLTPATDGKYYFATSNVSNGVDLWLYDEEWTRIDSHGYMYNGSKWYRQLVG